MRSLLALLALVAPVNASDDKSVDLLQHMHGRTTCAVVRQFVALVGSPEQAEKMARDAGASEAKIAAARRCMKDTK